LAESKKEVANQYYSQKQYKKALIGYNEAIGKYSKILYTFILNIKKWFNKMSFIKLF